MIYKDEYECPECGTVWTDTWCNLCDDKCPLCDTNVEVGNHNTTWEIDKNEAIEAEVDKE